MSIVLFLVLLLGLSYAWFTLTLNGTKQNVIKVGKLSLVLTEGNAITIEDAVPTYMETALQEKPYHFTIENDGTVEASYSLYLDPTGDVTSGSLLARFYYVLKKDGKIINIGTLKEIDDIPVQSGIISPQGKSEYDLYIWYGADNTVQVTKTYQGVLRIESEQSKTQKLSQYVMHACDGKDECTRVDQEFTYFQQGYYAPSIRKYVWYSGKLWIVTGYDSDGNVKMMTADPQTIIPWGTTSDYQGSHVETWINEEFLPTLNNYQNLLVTDQVWNYSKSTGTNTDPIGTDRLVTSPVGLLNSWDVYQAGNLDNQFSDSDRILSLMGKIYLGNASSTGNIFSGGLQTFDFRKEVTPDTNEFLGVSPAVVVKKDVLVISGTGTKDDPYRFKGDDHGKANELLNTRYAGEYVAFGDNVNYSYRISKIEDEKTKLISAHPLLELFIDKNNQDREYIYLFDTEDHAKNPPVFHYPYKTEGGDLLYYSANDSINYPLGYFLNHSFLSPINGFISTVDKSMILENQTWYTGTVRGGESYKNAKDSTKQVTATVSLPSIGDANSVLQSSDKKTGKLFPRVMSHIYGGIFLTNNGTDLYSETTLSNQPISQYGEDGIYGWRPTFYLKSNVKIKSGSGTKLDPYILTME